ncbi:MAG: hypothetical protein CVU57_27790 [Deltaproteobacteria bacterium HGW-Deltaproteobacteria-15]|jgi:hypothetical protein|nr:MAG: hypothetical protein CVU57_27790 [Deltaproteobacteria bacterium HGW-Deltaproteobacteria-15]
MKPPDHSNNASDAPLPSRIMERAAREQLAGPFGKLARYSLKQHWGITVSDRQENGSNFFLTSTEETKGTIRKRPAKTKGLFRRIIAYLKKPFRE